MIDSRPFLLTTTKPPPTPTNTKAAKLLVKELNSIPTLERNKLLERIHGVEMIVPETPDFVKKKIEELNGALEQITVKYAYNLALSQNRRFVQNNKFCLQFLRAECFDAVKAANRMVLYCEEKLRRFGSRALARPLLMKDLQAAARTLLARSGTLQVVSARDRTGRVVLFCYLDASMICGEKPVALGDAAFYMINAAAEDEETQKKGALTITVVGNIASSDDVASLQKCIEQGGLWHPYSSPLRINAHHMWPCKLTPLSWCVLGHLNVNMGTDFRLLSKIHSDSYEETKHEMKTFGIPTELLPLSLDGCELRKAFHQKWIRRRPQKEEQMQLDKNFGGIDLPSCQDVCLQRGTTFHLHPGNLLMRSLMEPLVAEYQNSASERRKELNDMVIRAIHAAGGRFLSRSEEGWFMEILDHAEVNKSVGASFRSLLTRTRKQMAASGSKRPSPLLAQQQEVAPTIEPSRTNGVNNNTTAPPPSLNKRIKVQRSTCEELVSRSMSEDTASSAPSETQRNPPR